ncbi:MAG TPA: aldo/keto reductase [Bacillota bacterium]|nr:aldo/keto reductase [Bacillota bacterium]
MERRQLGRTGLTLPAIGFGCGNVGGLMVRGDAALRERAVAAALEAGIDYFDTAAQYGSEANLGAALRAARALQTASIGTKVRLSPEDLRDPAPALRAALEAGLRRIGRDHVDILHLHNQVDVALAPGVADGMERLVDAGRVRHAGVTGLGATADLQRAVGRFATMQTYVNLLNPSAFFPGAAGGAQDFAGVGRAAADAGMGVFAIRVMAAGAVAGPVARPPLAGGVGGALVQGADYAGDLARVAALPFPAGPEVALRFVLSLEGVSTALVGFSDLDQLAQAVRWAAAGPLPTEVVARIVAGARA